MTLNGGNLAFAALSQIVDFDRSLAFDPIRIRAALLDVVCDDEPGSDLVVISTRLGVPASVAAGDSAAAQLLLVDSVGLRTDVAGELVAAWQRALGVSQRDGGETAGEQYRDLRVAAPAITLGAIGPADCQVWPDGAVSVLVLGMDGLVLSTLETPIQGSTASWHRIAEPNAPISRAAALASITPTTSLILWTDNSGLWSRPILRDSANRTVQLGEARLVDLPTTGQARYPMAALAVDGREVDIFWTVDRRQLLVSTRDGFGAIQRRTVSCLGESPERLAALDCAVAGETTGWVAALTDRGRLLLTRWDIPSGEPDGWRVLDCPMVAPTTLTVVRLAGGVSILVGALRGGIGAVDAANAYAGSGGWRTVPMPGATNLTGLRSLAASSKGDLSWAVCGADDSLRLIRLQRYEENTEALECLVIS